MKRMGGEVPLRDCRWIGDRTYGPIGINGGVVHTRVEVEAGLHRLR